MNAIKFLKKNKLLEIALGLLLWLEQLAVGSFALKTSSQFFHESSIELGADHVSVNYYATISVYLIWAFTLYIFIPLLINGKGETESYTIKPRYIIYMVFGFDLIIFGIFIFPVGYVYFQQAASWLGYALLYFTLRWRVSQISGKSHRSSQK